LSFVIVGMPAKAGLSALLTGAYAPGIAGLSRPCRSHRHGRHPPEPGLCSSGRALAGAPCGSV